MTFSYVTVTVLLSNGVMAVLTAALLVLVWWQAPRQRMNQYFALTMLALGAYGVANGLGRFIDTLGLDPRATTLVAASLYMVFVALLFVFTAEFVKTSRVMRWVRNVGLLTGITHLVALWNDLLIVNIRPAPLGDGSYVADWTLYGQLSVAVLFGYTVVAAVVLYRTNDTRGHMLWLSPVLVLAAIVSHMLIWPRFHLPTQSIFLALAALAAGLPVLRHELLNPLARLNMELRRNVAELQQTYEARSKFLAGISQTLYMPLGTLAEDTRHLLAGEAGPLSERQRDRLQRVAQNTRHLRQMIDDALVFNQLERGQVKLERQPVDAVALLDEVLNMIEPLAQDKGLALKREYEKLPRIFADPLRLRQVLTNILANAVKFTESGAVTVRARAEGGFVRFEVEDTGIGIPQDAQERIFEEFQQVDGSSIYRFQGAGLGLAIARRLIRMHGGHIWLKSAEGQGSTFYVTVPVVPASSDVSAASAPTQDMQPAVP